jgi:mannose-6-phosphate isomerase-like protein (cupin superfamily)
MGSALPHETLADHERSLPTSSRRPERRFGGQLFVRHEVEFLFVFMLSGTATLDGDALGPDDAVVIPPGDTRRLDECSSDLEFLEVTLPAISRRPVT